MFHINLQLQRLIQITWNDPAIVKQLFLNQNLTNMKNAISLRNLTLCSTALFLSVFIGCGKDEIELSNATLDALEEAKGGKKLLSLGQEYGGGIIYYLDETGRHGLIAAKEDLGPAPWGCLGTLVPYDSDPEKMARNILRACDEPGIAARLCDEYVVYEKPNNKGKKYDDWFMPSTPGEMFGIVQLTCWRSYWTTHQAESMTGGQANPANIVMHMGPACNAAGTNTSMGYSWSDKTKLHHVRPVRKF